MVEPQHPSIRQTEFEILTFYDRISHYELWSRSIQNLNHLINLSLESVKLLSHVWLFATPWTVDYQASLSMGFSRQEYWSRLPFPSPGDLPNPGIEPRSLALQADALPLSHQGSPIIDICAPFFLILWAYFLLDLFLLLCFLPRDAPLAFVIQLVWWCKVLLTFVCLESFWFLHQIWRRVLLGRVFLVVVSSLSSLQIYRAIPFCLEAFLLRNQLVARWEFPCMLFVIFPLLFLVFYLCF